VLVLCSLACGRMRRRPGRAAPRDFATDGGVGEPARSDSVTSRKATFEKKAIDSTARRSSGLFVSTDERRGASAGIDGGFGARRSFYRSLAIVSVLFIIAEIWRIEAAASLLPGRQPGIVRFCDDSSLLAGVL
jgi:hypothetical protein